MRIVRTGILLLLCAALLAASGCGKGRERETQTIEADTAVLTVGDVPVYALTYRYQLSARYDAIQKSNLFDRDTYLSFVVSPTVYYPYPYYDTRTEEGMKALCEDVLSELALEAASIYAAKQKGYTLSIEDQSYIRQAEENARESIEELAESYGSVEAFYRETGLSEETLVRMHARSREAAIDFGKLLEAYREMHTIDDATLESGYARIVKETFEDRYTDGMYSQYLYHYITGARSYPSLYIPDDAIFVRLFVHTDPTEAQKQAYLDRAQTDFGELYMSRDNEFTSQGTAGDVAVAPKDSLVDGLYDAAKDVATGDIGSMTVEKDGKTTFCLFMRVDGETGRVPIDRYPGVREMIVRQLTGTFCMDTLREMVSDPSVTVRDDALIDAIKPDA